MVHEVARMGGAPVALEIGRGGDEVTAHATQPPRPQGGIGQCGDAQSGIEPCADQVDQLIAQMQIDRNARVFGKKLRKERRHLPEAEGHRHGEAHEPARARRLGMGLAFGCLALGKDARGAIEQELTCVGERQPARSAIEQSRAEPLLQPGDGL